MVKQAQKQKKMTKNELVGALEKDFAEDEWQQSTSVVPEQEFNGPDKKYPVRLKYANYYKKDNVLKFKFTFTITREDERFAGQTISKFYSMKASGSRSKQEALEELFADIQLILGRTIKGLPMGELPALFEELIKTKPTTIIRVRTSTFEGNDGEEVEWKWVTVLGNADDSEVDSSSIEEMDVLVLGGEADEGSQEAAAEVARRASIIGVDPDETNDDGTSRFPNWTSVAQHLSENSPELPNTKGAGLPASNFEGSSSTFEESTLGDDDKTLGVLADEGDEEAIAEITRLAEEAEAVGHEWSVPWDEITYTQVEDELAELEAQGAVSDAQADPPGVGPDPTSSGTTPPTQTSGSSGIPDRDTLVAMGQNVDATGDNDDYEKLEAYAAKVGVDTADESLPQFVDVANAIADASEQGSSEPASEPSDGGTPAKGEMYLYAPRKGLEPKACKVTKSLKTKQTVDLKRSDDDKVFTDVPWDKLGAMIPF